MSDWTWINIALALIWIGVWGVALWDNGRLLRIYHADRVVAARAGDPLLALIARGHVQRLEGRVLGAVVAIGLGVTSLWGRLTGGGAPLNATSTIFSVVFIGAAAVMMARGRAELRDRAEMERLIALSSDS